MRCLFPTDININKNMFILLNEIVILLFVESVIYINDCLLVEKKKK